MVCCAPVPLLHWKQDAAQDHRKLRCCLRVTLCPHLLSLRSLQAMPSQGGQTHTLEADALARGDEPAPGGTGFQHISKCAPTTSIKTPLPFKLCVFIPPDCFKRNAVFALVTVWKQQIIFVLVSLSLKWSVKSVEFKRKQKFKESPWDIYCTCF